MNRFRPLVVVKSSPAPVDLLEILNADLRPTRKVATRGANNFIGSGRRRKQLHMKFYIGESFQNVLNCRHVNLQYVACRNSCAPIQLHYFAEQCKFLFDRCRKAASISWGEFEAKDFGAL